ncbi:MAG: hypothetical protein M0C28_22055 [Candidatus Moduliflexus flocculans]|nr:hypothetical protein [Candidatus Moduliflexus flocculans]
MVLEDFRTRAARMDYHILATDISTQVLESASRGDLRRGQGRSHSLRASRRSSCSGARTGTGRGPDPVRSSASRWSFARINFMDETYPVPSGFDTVFCRNVIIYFDRTTQERILGHICAHIRPGRLAYPRPFGDA